MCGFFSALDTVMLWISGVHLNVGVPETNISDIFSSHLTCHLRNPLLMCPAGCGILQVTSAYWPASKCRITTNATAANADQSWGVAPPTATPGKSVFVPVV